MDAPGGAATLVGRTDELLRIREVLDGGSALIVGEPGIGKTTLWGSAVDQLRSAGFDVLTASPTAAERLFSYAVLADLVEPIPPQGMGLPAPQQRAMQQALLTADDDAMVDPQLVSVAVRTLLARRVKEARVIVAIDDVQWADEASMATLWFALRRTPGVVLLASTRKDPHLQLPIKVERVELGGLTPGALHHLIVQHLGHSLPRPTLLRLHEISAGNPFYALELARMNTGTDAPALPESLLDLLADRLNALPPQTREALAKAALGGAWDGDLAPAMDVGVLRRGRPFRFSHPLYAEAAIDLTSEATRQRLHGEIAAATDNAEIRARHMALSASGPDTDIADTLEEAAQQAARRGALLAASTMWRSAAELTPPADERRRAERWVESGIALLLAGSPDEAENVLGEYLPLLPPGPLRHRGLIHLALMDARTDSRAVIPQLEAVLAEVDEPYVRHEVIALLVAFATTVGDGTRARKLVLAHLSWAEQHAPDLLPAALLMAASRETLDDRPAWHLLDRARAAAANVDEVPRPAWGWALRAPALMREDRWDEARLAVEAAQRDEPAATVYQEGSRALSLAIVELAIGDAHSAWERADEVLCIGEQIVAPYLICQGHIGVAEAATLLGDVETARLHIDAAISVAEPVHAQIYLDSARQTLGLLHLSTGDVASAAAAFEAVTDEGYSHYGAVAGGRMHVDAVEAMTAVGSQDRARLTASAIPAYVWEHAVATALLLRADGDIEAALDTLRGAQVPRSPFRQARNLLLEGRWQRTLRQRATAREVLSSARELFASIDAALWVARVDDELGRLGGRRPAGTALTESERRVAELVASGLSNKEVATRLVVSQRTVEVHLTKIYSKLDVTGRTALVARWPVG